MARITIERSHALGRDAARERAEALAARLVEKFGVGCRWEGDVLAVRHSGASGRIEVGADCVRVLLELGLLMAPMAGLIRAQVEQALDAALVV